MRAVQLLPTVSYGDAVGNDTIAIDAMLREMGYGGGIYAENIDQRLPAGLASTWDQLPALGERDVLIYHGSTGTALNYLLPRLGGRKVLIYHNVTPPSFFEPYSKQATELTLDGVRGFYYLFDKFDYGLAVSEFDRQDLLRMGYTCPIDVCPILIPFADYEKTPDQALLRRYRGDGYTNLLFVGRIAPNKKQEDLLRMFYFYRKYHAPRSRLILAGSATGMERYEQRLREYAAQLGIAEDVIFTGHIKFDGILAWYRLADAFVCMSEHEGFCVPLVEAMFFGVPVFAYASTAIPGTLGGSGVLLPDKDPVAAAACVDRVLRDEALRQAIVAGEKRRLADFSYAKVGARFRTLLESFMRGETT